ncbi:MAG TPA: hypothetical protein VFA15_01015 [Nitrososphaera sp.]|nr:hypothetical protein [Nitrososphaera sp.]
MDEAMEEHGRERAEEVLSGMKEWRKAHRSSELPGDRRSRSRTDEPIGSATGSGNSLVEPKEKLEPLARRRATSRYGV